MFQLNSKFEICLDVPIYDVFCLSLIFLVFFFFCIMLLYIGSKRKQWLVNNFLVCKYYFK